MSHKLIWLAYAHNSERYRSEATDLYKIIGILDQLNIILETYTPTTQTYIHCQEET